MEEVAARILFLLLKTSLNFVLENNLYGRNFSKFAKGEGKMQQSKSLLHLHFV